MNITPDYRQRIDTSIKKFYTIKTNGIANIRSINMSLGAFPSPISFWLPGFMQRRKLRGSTVLRKQFLFYDYAFISLFDPYAFETFLNDRKIPAYFLYVPGTKTPIALTDEEIQRIKQLEAFKQVEVDNLQDINLNVGSLIEVCNGPFIGCKGVVIEIRPNLTVLEMNVFGRPTRININNEFLSNVLQNYNAESSFPSDEAQ